MYTSKRVIRPNDEVVRYYCDNGYGLSVACHEHSYGGKEGLYEIALLKGDSYIMTTTNGRTFAGG